MAYIGKEPPFQPSNSQFVESFNGTGAQTVFLLSKRPSSVYSAAVFVSGVHQKYTTDYYIDGFSLIFQVTPATGTGNIVVHHIAVNERSIVPVDGSVTIDKLDPNIKIGGATGGGTDRVFFENDQSVNTTYTLSAGKNAVTVGPLTVADGVVVTVPSGSRLVVL